MFGWFRHLKAKGTKTPHHDDSHKYQPRKVAGPMGEAQPTMNETLYREQESIVKAQRAKEAKKAWASKAIVQPHLD